MGSTACALAEEGVAFGRATGAVASPVPCLSIHQKLSAAAVRTKSVASSSGMWLRDGRLGGVRAGGAAQGGGSTGGEPGPRFRLFWWAAASWAR